MNEEMKAECSAHEKDEKRLKILVIILEERSHLEDLGVGESTGLMFKWGAWYLGFSGSGYGSLALLNTLMNLRFP
jgi:hypothetical protein